MNIETTSPMVAITPSTMPGPRVGAHDALSMCRSRRPMGATPCVLAMSPSFVKGVYSGQGLPARSRAQPRPRCPRGGIWPRPREVHCNRLRGRKGNGRDRLFEPRAGVSRVALGEGQRMYIGGGVIVLILIII